MFLQLVSQPSASHFEGGPSAEIAAVYICMNSTNDLPNMPLILILSSLLTLIQPGLYTS
jgi:hypothetical protein